MNIKKILKRTGTFLFAFGVMGTTAFAATAKTYTYNLGLGIEECKYTEVVKKETTSSTAYVTRQTPDTPVTTIRVSVWNSGVAIKSNIKSIKGVGTAKPSYSGYNVDAGDYLRLRIYNSATINKGASISAGGTWRP